MPERAPRFPALALLLVAGILPATLSAQPPSPTSVGVLFHVLQTPEGPIVDEEWLAARLARANELFVPAHIHFESMGTRPLDVRHRHLVTRRDRHALASGLRGMVINVFVVDTMQDVDDPDRMLRGVHWKLPGDHSRHWVILTASRASPLTFPHELGHFFGNHRHSEVAGNIMSYSAGRTPAFDADQLRIIRAELRRFRRRSELLPVAEIRARLATGGSLPGR